MTARYLIAKYIPDLIRNEPRNIGVILWSESKTVARFWASDHHGDMDKRKIPSWISPESTYVQWVKTWFRLINQNEMRFIGEGKIAKSTSSEFTKALLTSSNGNYILQEGGEIFEEINEKNILGALDYLYRTLVREEQEAEPDALTLDKACEEIISETKLDKDDHLKKDKLIECFVGDVQKSYEFSYYYGNGRPEWLAQKVPLSVLQKEMDKTVESFAWKFEKVSHAGIVGRDRSIALVYPQGEQHNSKAVKEAIAELSTVSTVIDVGDRSRAISEFLRLSKHKPGH